MVTLVLDIVDACDTNAQGEVILSLLDANIVAGKKVTLDFAGVFNVTSSFVNVAFVELLDRHDFQTFGRLVSLKNANRQVASLIKQRVDVAATHATAA